MFKRTNVYSNNFSSVATFCFGHTLSLLQVEAEHQVSCDQFDLYIICMFKSINLNQYVINHLTNTAPSCDPGTKDTSKFSTASRIFLHDAQNGFILFPSF